MDEYVKCIFTGATTTITTGCTYRVVGKIGKLISIINDNGVERTYSSSRFIEQTQEKENNMQADQKARTMVQNRSYIVGSFDSLGKFSIATEPTEHLTEQKAKTEAKRLAGLNGDKTFVVMRFYAGFKSVQIQEI